MKSYIKADITGKGFFGRYIAFLIPILVLAAIAQWSDDVMPLLSTVSSLAESYLAMLLQVAFFCYLIQFVLFNEKSFGFSGRVGEAAPKFLKWYMLTVITLGIYGPWFAKNMINYYLERLDYEGKNGELLSKPGTLLKYLLLTLYLPIIVLSLVFGLLMYFRYGDMSYSYGFAPGIAGAVFLFIIAVFLIIIPFIYFYFVWVTHIRFGEYRSEFRRSLAETAGFLIPQLLLSIITLFIYYPAAIVKLYRYLLDGCVYTDGEGAEKGGFGFDGTAGNGFGLLWGQGLLTVITIGIYGPWAMSKVTNWFLNNTFMESNTGIEQ